MIEVHVHEALSCPVVVCDICGEPLREANKSAAVFANWKPNGAKVPVLFVHKGSIDGRTCHAQADAKLKAAGEDPGWQELSTFLRDLASNVGLKNEGQ